MLFRVTVWWPDDPEPLRMVVARVDLAATIVRYAAAGVRVHIKQI